MRLSCRYVNFGLYTFLRSTCWSVGEIPWCAILMFSVRLCVRRDGTGRFILMRGWCCRITCTVFGRCRQAMTIFPTAGNRSRFVSCKRSTVPSDDPQFELPKASVEFDSRLSWLLPFERNASKSVPDGFVSTPLLGTRHPRRGRLRTTCIGSSQAWPGEKGIRLAFFLIPSLCPGQNITYRLGR